MSAKSVEEANTEPRDSVTNVRVLRGNAGGKTLTLLFGVTTAALECLKILLHLKTLDTSKAL
jgi:hypothetical protein